MSCWVVPSLAAEYWGIPVDQVMSKLSAGEIASKEEHGFTLIDVAPESPRQPEPKKPSYPTISHSITSHESQLPEAVDDITEIIESEAFGDWRSARHTTSLRRKAPVAMLN